VTGSSLRLEVADGVGRVILDLPGEPINKITRRVGQDLEAALAQVRADPKVRAVILASGKADTFIAGADIEEFAQLASSHEAEALVRRGQALINRLEDLGKPVVAAIHGACLGGGLEASLACTYRIATEHPKTSLGLPEVQLGIIPAAGGCQRLPRLIGLRAALDIILAGKTVPSSRALRMGLVDEAVHPAILLPVAEAAARRLADGWRPTRRGPGVIGWVLEGNLLGRLLVAGMARRELHKKVGDHYPAPYAALDAVMYGLRHGLAAGLDREARHFAELAVGPVSRKLVQIFFATTALKKDSGISGPAPPPLPCERLAVVGAGFMGAAIGGVAAAQAQVDVRLKDADLDRVSRGLRAAGAILKDRLNRRRITKYEFRRLAALISGGTDWAGFHRAQLVIEAVFEDLAVKRQVFADLEAHVAPDCILASNTSTIPIARIAETMKHPDRVLGMHFFSPVERMPLLEVIAAERTAPWAVTSAVAFGRRLGKTVVVVHDRPGFWVNRILAPYLNEAGRLLEEGVRMEELDQAMTRFGFPVGPITLLDEVGIDVASKAAAVLSDAFGARMQPPQGIGRLVADGRLGRKGGRGFYRYVNGKRSGPDHSVYQIVGAAHGASRSVHADVEVRLVFAMLNEAVLALEERVVRSPRDGDIAALFGIGYPAFRGGPLRYLDDVGSAAAVSTLERLAASYGDRFRPAPRLVQMAARGERFYAG